MGGHNRMKMDALKKMYESIGLQTVTTYLQSGNVIFQTKETSEKTLEDLIAAKITETFGYNIEVLVIKMGDLQEIIANNPFAEKEEKFLFATILSEMPNHVDIEKIKNKSAENEDFKIVGRTVYFYMPNGYATTKLNNTLIERIFRLKATSRTLRTLIALADQDRCGSHPTKLTNDISLANT